MRTWEEFKKNIRSPAVENDVSHMYLDTKGLVTVGVGNMLPSAEEAQKLGFVNRQTRNAATKEEIRSDFESVSKQRKGFKASAYKQHTKLDLPQKEVNNLLDTRIDGFKKELKLKFPKFDNYPLTAQFALLDMAFTLGTNGLVTKFPNFKKAVEAEKWKEAAEASHRFGARETRNVTVKTWLEEAA